MRAAHGGRTGSLPVVAIPTAGTVQSLEGIGALTGVNRVRSAPAIFRGMPASSPTVRADSRQRLEPKLLEVLRGGYGVGDLRNDALAALTVAIVALPLAMALAIASGTTPEKGLHTAIVAGFLISLLGGSRVQIGGPTAAFIPVVYGVIHTHGYGGLVLCTLMAGLMLIGAGLLRLGTLMKYIPQPVITGFTAGIAVSIVLSQLRDLLGLEIATLPAEFLARLHAYFNALPTWNPWAPALAAGCVAVIVGMRRWKPTSPSLLVAVALGTVAVAVTGAPVETLGMRFPEGVPATVPQFALPSFPLEHLRELLPPAFAIAFLAGVESLLSATVADGMTGGRHRSNMELIAQGVANCGSALCGGLPATGAIARTATNIRAGARSPIAGMLHAAFLLVFVLLLAPLMAWVPLPALAAVLLLVAWNMAEIELIRHLLRGPYGDRLVLIVTFALTVVADLTVAIEVGVVLGALVFMHRMARVTAFAGGELGDADDAGSDDTGQRAALPPGVEVYRFNGPLFYAVASRLDTLLDQLFQPPRVLILRLRQVPLIDASGAAALRQFIDRAHRLGIRIVLSGLAGAARETCVAMDVLRHPAVAADVADYAHAVPAAQALLEGS